MRELRALVRAQLWWSAKVLPVIGAGALAALAADAEPGAALRRLVAMVVSAAGLAGAAHVINDWADVEVDRSAGKVTAVGRATPQARAAVLAAALALGLVPWAGVGLDRGGLVLLGLLVALPVAYSARPLRLKGRASAGVLADAANAHVVPTAFAVVLLGDVGHRTGSWWWVLAGALTWSFGFGVRSILVHQLGDELADRAGRVRTFVVRHGPVRAVVVGRRAFAVELAGAVVLAAAATAEAPVVGALVATYLALWLLQLRWDDRPFEPVPRRRDAWMPLAEFYEVWPTLLFAGALVARDPAWWPLPVAVVLGFAGAVTKQARDLGSLLASAAHDLRTLLSAAVGLLGIAVRATAWKARDVPWRARVLWYDGWLGRARYALKAAVTRAWLFARRQGRRFRRIVLRRHRTTP